MTQNKHYFKGNDLYYLKDVLDYIKKKNPSLKIPQCWSTGGSLNEKVRCEYGLIPMWTNEIEGRGHREKYTGNQLYTIAAYLTQDLKDGNIKTRRSRSLTPIEALASGDEVPAEEIVFSIKEGFGGPIKLTPVEPIINTLSDKEKLESEIQRIADELVNAFQSFMNKIIEAYMASS